MESKPSEHTEEKKQEEVKQAPPTAEENAQFSLEVKEIFEKLSIDPKADDFNLDQAKLKLLTLSQDKQVHFHDRDRYKHVLKLLAKHKFWETQAITLPDKATPKEGEIQKFAIEDVPKEPISLPPGFEWASFDVTVDAEAEEVCEFLQEHYVEDENNNFRLLYKKEKFRWAIATPGFIKDCHFLVRNSKNKKIMATIIGCPRKIVICGKTVKIMEVNFLAVHKKLREKRLAQKMIEEMMRRKRLHGFPQAYYTSGHTMPTPFATSLYLNRFINCKKLVEIKYTNKPHDMPMKNFEKRYRLPDKQGTGLVGVIRPMLKKDLTAVLKLYHAQMAKTQIYYKMSQEEIAHFLLPKDDVVWTYVVEGEVDGKSAVTDFFSMYRLSQTCTSKAELGHNYDDMHSGCMFYYGLSANSLKSLMKEALWKAKEELSCDAFTVMTIMENKREMFLEDLGFLPGDGALHWYFVNWSLGDKKIESHDIGTILI